MDSNWPLPYDVEEIEELSYLFVNKQGYGRTISRAMRTNSRTIGAGEPINWDEVYS